MRIQEPKFRLKQSCPNCDQAGALLFLTCPNCQGVIIACDEEGSVFPEPRDLTKQASWPCDPWVSTVTKCPHCEEEGEFSFSAGGEIQALGFTPDQYE